MLRRAAAVIAVFAFIGALAAYPATAAAVGAYANAAIADYALARVGQWGGQCRQFVNDDVWAVSGHTQSIGGGNGAFANLAANGTEITDINALVKGDVVQFENSPVITPLHTFIIVSRASGNTFNVVDSNWVAFERVGTHQITFTLDSTTRRAFRFGTAGSPSNPPSPAWWGPWAGAPVVACEPNDVWLRVNDNGSALTWVGGQAIYGDGLNDIGQFFWVSGGDFQREYWFPLNTSQIVTLRGTAQNGAGTTSSDYVRYVTDERWFVAGDFDGDGKGDVARLVDDGSNAMSIWLGRSDGTRFSYSKAYSSGAGNWSRLLTQAVAGDVDGDGKAEIVALYRYGDNASGIWVFDLNASGQFSARKPYNATSGKEWYKMKPLCADIDGDGRDEFVVAFDYAGWNGYDTGFMSWDLEGATAAEPISPWTETHDGWWDWSHSFFLGGDFDGDGTDEIAAYYNYTGGVTGLFVFDNLSAGKFTSIVKKTDLTQWGFPRDKATAGDFDGDGHDEIAHFYDYGGSGFAIGLWITDGIENVTPTYSRPWTAPVGSWDWTRVRPLAADVDGDGKDEVFAFYDYGGKTTREAWGSWFWRPDRGSWAAVKAWNKPTGSWALAPDLNASFANPTAVTTISVPSSCVYGSATVSGTLKTSSGGPIAGRVVVIEALTAGSLWSAVASTTTDATGVFSAGVAPTRPTAYRAVFAGDYAYASAASAGATVTPGAPPNAAPVAVADAYPADGGLTLSATAPGVLANDTDIDGDSLTASLVSDVSHGTLSLKANGSFTYTPAVGFAGADSFTYRAYDGKAFSSPVTVTITVRALPDTTPPHTTSDRVPYYADSATILLTASDNDGGSGVAHTYYRLNGGAQVEGTTITKSTAGSYSLVYWSVDAAGNIEAPHTVTFTIIAKPSTGGTPSTPASIATLRHGKSFTVYGYIIKHTAGTYPVTLQFYRYQSGHWVLRKSTTAKASNMLTFSKYSDSTSVPYSGKWRVRARHKVGTKHLYSGYRTFSAS